MLKSAQDEAQQNAKESIAQVISGNSEEAEESTSNGARGFLGKFQDTVNYLTNGEEEKKKKADQERRDIAIKAKIENEIAPKIAVQALGEAVMLGSEKLGVSKDSIQEMKQKMAQKIKKPASEELMKFD